MPDIGFDCTGKFRKFFYRFYSFRLVMLVFFARPKSEEHAHEAKNYMLIVKTFDRQNEIRRQKA